MNDISLLDPIRSALRTRTWEYKDGKIAAVGVADHPCEVVEAENDGRLYGLATSKEQAIAGVVYAVVCEAKRRGASKLIISPMRLRSHAASDHFCVNVMFQ